MTYSIAFDCVRRRPGCVLIQTALGATIPRQVFAMKFPHDTWLTGHSDDMKLYPITDAQIDRLAHIARQAVATNSP